MKFKKTQQKKEETRLEKVASWYNPEQRFHLINYRVRAMLPKIRGPKVLEMGCSTGVMTRCLAKKFPTLTVVDGSKKYIEYTKNLVKTKKAKFIVSLFENLKAKERFDDIIMANVLEHVTDPVLILKKANSWLKKDGKIHVMVPNAESLHRRIGQKMGIIKNLDDFSEKDKEIGHRRVYTKKSLRKDVAEAGLKVVWEEGVFLKPLSHSQISNLDKKVLDAFFEIGKELSDYCSTIYFVCKKK